MSRVDGRGNSIPPHQSTVSSRNDDSGSSSTPGGTAENSVAYQYVPVQQMTSNRDHIEFQLTVREQPKQSRMCGIGEKADRRPIDPAPIVQLRVISHDRPVRQNDTSDTASAAAPLERRPGHGSKLPKTPGVRRGIPVTTALGHGWEDKAWYLENPYFFMYAMLCNAETDEELHLLHDGKTRYTSGSCVSCLYHLKDIDGSHQGFFVFPDLSIRVEGRYRLKLCLFETIGHSVHHCKSIYSDPFHVYTAKRFPGMEESTKLSKSFAEQGLKVRVRKHPRSRRRSSKRTKDHSDPSDGDAPLARDRSPKRAKASDFLPRSSLPIPQPIASSMPHSLDARYERAEYESKPSSGSPHGLKTCSSRRHSATWEGEEAMRISDARSGGFGLDHDLYARQPPPPRRDGYVDARRHANDVSLFSQPSTRDRLAPPPPPSHYGASAMAERPEYGRRLANLPRDDPANLRGMPSSAITSPPPSLARNHLEPVAARNHHPPALDPGSMLTRRSRFTHSSRSHASPDHKMPHGFEDYHGPPSQPRASGDPRYSGAYETVPRARFSPSPPPPGRGDHVGGGAFGPLPPSTSSWRPGPPNPHPDDNGRRVSQYFDRNLPPRSNSPPLASVRSIAAPPTALISDNNMSYRRGLDPPALGRSAYDPEPGFARMRPLDPYGREEEGYKPSDKPPPATERFPHGMLHSRDRPMLPPLSAGSPAFAQRESRSLSSREYGFPGERYPGYVTNRADAELEREREWERERMGMQQRTEPPRQSQAGMRQGADGYPLDGANREWDAKGSPRQSDLPGRSY
ncbi:related to velvet A protein [Melanopsichium pennsylvanicum]|uniref:Related to velvet A protein n=2 Tax=Melanopsichium pennsylvanicum TaxID=63383 RepID=A0AAJ4XH53_9BASI|nr:uncharacterized protein BN887_00447 [Melanopsichium pennsylvanicum 4]SNX82309.1 related to velvet A protein [Melanopsichium pennsylvanicum]